MPACPRCPTKKFPNYKTLWEHAIKSKKKPHSVCTLCKRIFIDAVDLKKVNVHYISNIPKTDQNYQHTSFECCITCDEHFSSPAALAIHRATIHCSGYHRCQECYAAFYSAELLYEHDRLAHSPCTTCGKTFDSMLEYRQHITTAHPVDCRYCGRKFHAQGGLDAHRKDVHKPRFRCGLCGGIFAQKTHKHVHRRANHPTCSKCDQSFACLNDLEDHVLRAKHLCECDKCPITFLSQSSLNYHLLHGIHSKLSLEVSLRLVVPFTCAEIPCLK